jgi:preprotein translocase subunit SecA
VEFHPPEEERLKLTSKDLREKLYTSLVHLYERRVQEVGDEVFRDIERYVLLRVVDYHWKDHLHNMDHLREGIGLRAVGQKDPFVEYQLEAFEMFQNMVAAIREDALRYLFHVRVVPERKPSVQRASEGSRPASVPQPQKVQRKVGRNDPCPCGSGLKYKYCCGKK